MATNENVNKVIFGDQTVMDISDTTAVESDVISGKSFYKANGAKATGTASFNVNWGQIGGTLSDQNDLNYALQQKADNTSIRAIENLIDDTVGFSGKNLADISQAEVGKDISGATDANKIRLIVPCESGKAYYMTASGTNAFNKIYYVTVADPSVIPSYAESASLPTRVAIPSGHKYIVLEFRKSSAASFADLQNLKFMVYDEVLYSTEILSGGVIYAPYHKDVDYVKSNREELKDTVGWIVKNLAESYFITTNTSSGSNALFVEADLKPNTEYILSFDTNNAYEFVVNTNLTKSGTIVFTTTSGKNEVRFTTVDNLSRSDNTQYNATYGWRVLINHAVQPSTVSLTNIMLRKASISDNTYEPYHPSVKRTLRDGEVIEGRQKLIYPYYDTSKVLNGLTFTDNGDNSISVVGSTPSYDTFFTFQDRRESKKIKAGKYTLSIDNYPPTSYLYVDAYNGNTWVKTLVTLSSSTKSGTFDIDYIGYDGIQIYAKILQNTTISNAITIKPMLCLADEEDKTFTPYYIPLKDSKFDRAEQRVLGAKNLYPFTQGSNTVNGITYVTDADGVITANGTATATATNTAKLIQMPAGSYIISGCPKGGGESNYRINIEVVPQGGSSTTKTDLGNGFVYESAVPFQIRIYPRIANGYTASNLKFYPMLRLASDPDDTYAPYAMTNKELTDKVESIYKTATASSDGSSVTFTGVDTSKSYDLDADLGTSWDGPAPSYTNIQISGTTVVYTLENATAGQSFRLIDLKR